MVRIPSGAAVGYRGRTPCECQGRLDTCPAFSPNTPGHFSLFLAEVDEVERALEPLSGCVFCHLIDGLCGRRLAGIVHLRHKAKTAIATELNPIEFFIDPNISTVTHLNIGSQGEMKAAAAHSTDCKVVFYEPLAAAYAHGHFHIAPILTQVCVERQQLSGMLTEGGVSSCEMLRFCNIVT
jgi:hypothetical protein